MYSTTDKIIWLPASDYVLHYRDAEKFIGYCRSCAQYHTSWACPPFDFDTDAYLAGYRNVMIVATKLTLRLRKTNDREAKRASQAMIRQERKRLDAALLSMERHYPGSRSCFAGTCLLCEGETCTRPAGLPCRHPERIRPSLESLGFDIGRTCSEMLHIDLAWGKAGELPEYYTLVSGFFTNYDMDSVLW